MMITEGTVVIAVEYVARGQIMFLIKTNQGEEKDFFFPVFIQQEYQDSFSWQNIS